MPFDGELGVPEELAAGFPSWAVFVFLACAVSALLAVAGALSWRPAAAGPPGKAQALDGEKAVL